MGTFKRERSPSDDGNSAKRRAGQVHMGSANKEETGSLQSRNQSQEKLIPRRVDIVADGDLVITVGESNHRHSKQKEGVPEDNEATAFTVRSSTVLAASSKLENVLWWGVSESMASIPGIRSVRLENEKPKPLATLLYILHAQFDQVPVDKPDIVEIHEIAILADKYGLMRLLRPWARNWMHCFAKPATQLGFANTCRCLSVAWLFGDAALFRSTIDNIARYSRVHQFKIATLQNSYRLGFPTYGVPDIYNIVGDLRLVCLESLLGPLKESVDNLLQGVCDTRDGIQCRIIDPYEPDSSCNMSLLATLMRSLVSAELWPVPQAELCLETFNTINGKVQKLKVVCKPSHQKYGCDNILNEDLPRWARVPRATLNETQLAHLKVQAEKTGIKNE